MSVGGLARQAGAWFNGSMRFASPACSCLGCLLAGGLTVFSAERAVSTAENRFSVELGPAVAPDTLLAGSLSASTLRSAPALPTSRRDWKACSRPASSGAARISPGNGSRRTQGQYDWEPYDRLIEQCRQHGLQLFGNLAYGPEFHDTAHRGRHRGLLRLRARGGQALRRQGGSLADLERAQPRVLHGGNPELYARLLAAAGKAIHEANPKAKVLGLNMAFCDVLWAEKSPEARALRLLRHHLLSSLSATQRARGQVRLVGAGPIREELVPQRAHARTTRWSACSFLEQTERADPRRWRSSASPSRSGSRKCA